MTLSSDARFVRQSDADARVAELSAEIERLLARCKTLKEERDRAIDRLAAAFD